MLYALQGVLLLLVLAMFFAYLIAPLVEVLERPIGWGRHGWVMPRALAIGIVYVALSASVTLASYALLPLLGAQ